MTTSLMLTISQYMQRDIYLFLFQVFALVSLRFLATRW